MKNIIIKLGYYNNKNDNRQQQKQQINKKLQHETQENPPLSRNHCKQDCSLDRHLHARTVKFKQILYHF